MRTGTAQSREGNIFDGYVNNEYHRKNIIFTRLAHRIAPNCANLMFLAWIERAELRLQNDGQSIKFKEFDEKLYGYRTCIYDL